MRPRNGDVDSEGTMPPLAHRSTMTKIFPLSALAVGILVTWWVYRPDRNLPFDFIDFSEFLPLLQPESLGDRFAALLDYYAGQHGRVSVVTYAWLAAKWGLFDDHTPSWQWLRFLTMWAIVILTYRLCRRLRLSSIASVVGSSMFLFSAPAIDAFVRLTTGEPGGLLLVVGMCGIALWSRPIGGEAGVALILAVLAAVLILTKEMLVATISLPMMLAYFESRLESSVPRGRFRTVMVSLLLSSAVCSVAVLLWIAKAPEGAFSADFGTTVAPLSQVVANTLLALFPFDPGTSFPGRILGIALLSYIAMLVWGWRWALGPTSESGRMNRWLLLAGLLFPVTGALIYMPWPAYQRFYALPYLLGGTLLVAVAIHGIGSRSRPVLSVALIIWAVFLAAGASEASAYANRMAARQVVNRAAVARLSSLRALVDTVLVPTNQRVPAEWQGIGPTLERYGKALGLEMPIVRNTPCEGPNATTAPKRSYLAFSALCSGFRAPDPIVLRYQRPRLFERRVDTDSLRVDFIIAERRTH